MGDHEDRPRQTSARRSESEPRAAASNRSGRRCRAGAGGGSMTAASQWIEVDGEVLAAIKDAAEPFVDNPNRVLRRLFELPAIEKDGTASFPAKIARAPRSSLLPLADFELAILRAVADAGGEASRSKLMEVLGR